MVKMDVMEVGSEAASHELKEYKVRIDNKALTVFAHMGASGVINIKVSTFGDFWR